MNSKRQSKTSDVISTDVPTRTLPDRWQAGMSGCDEKGIVFIAVIGLIAIIALVGTVGVLTTITEIKISSNYKTGTKALYAAQAGIEEARARLRGLSSDANYAGDPAASPNQAWSAYILTSSSWQTSDDPNYIGTYTNYIPTTSSHINTTVGTNTIQATPDISYWVKIRHKREADLLSNEPWTDYATSTTNAIIYYGYAISTSTTAEQFTSDNAPPSASPVQIMTSYGSSGNGSGVIEVQARKHPGPPIPGAVYGDKVHLHADDDDIINITGNDDGSCSPSSDPVPAVAYVDAAALKLHETYTLTSDAGATTQITALDLATHIDELESIATVILDNDDDPLSNYTLGSSSNYKVVFCDATQLTDRKLTLNNVTGYGILVVRGKIQITGTINWNGLIMASDEIKFENSTTGTIYGAILSAVEVHIRGDGVDVNYSSCKIDNAMGSIPYSVFRWEDKKLIN